MNFMKNKKQILSALFILGGTAVSVLLLYLGIKIIPNAVTYTASTSENSIAESEDDISDGSQCLYESVYVISENGPFNISAEGQDIYIFSGNRRLYRIKANLLEFPSADKDAVLSGISISDKASLYEIVEYMES